MNRERLQLGRSAQQIRRFHIMPTIFTQTVGSHSFGVCLLLLEITAGTASANLLKAGLYHDLSEAITGDMPSPTLKSYRGLALEMELAEQAIVAAHDLGTSLTEWEADALRFADSCELGFFAVEETRRGSQQAEQMYDKVIDRLFELASKLNVDEVYAVLSELRLQMKEASSGRR